jgi:broad specificity phosphatase PhoE
VLRRIDHALRSLIWIAAYESDSGCVAAVTHSSYLRLLLGFVEGFALFSATSPQANGGINVIDFPRPVNLGHTNGKTDSIADALLSKGRVVRVNEKRHLLSVTASASRSSFATIV